MNTIFKFIVKVLMLPVNLVRWLLRALLWLIAMPFRIINAIFVFPFWFLRWLFSFLHHKDTAPATIVRMQQVQNFADQEGHVVFNRRGKTIPIRLTMYERKKFFGRNSEGDVGQLTHRGNWLVKWKLATADNPVVSGEKTPLVFLSYAHEWKDDAKYVANYLGKSGVKVWFDEERLMVGDALNKKVIQAVQGADYFIPLLCRDYNLSKWCIQELETAVAADRKILPVKVESGELVMPPYIDRLFKVDLGDPLFIDLRKKNPIDQLNQLITTMTG
jgi:hypothetical protein